MQTVFNPATHAEITARIQNLQPHAVRKWGKMNAAQMCTHCALVLEMANGERPAKQSLIGKILAPFFRNAIAGPEAFKRNAPTGPPFRVADARDFVAEKARLQRAVDRFVSGGPANAAAQEHGFLGRLSGDKWGRLMWKHLDHHLGQFSA